VATVLLVEDDAPVLILAESVLQHNGYETISASTLAEAEAILQSDAKFDIVATDIGLGDELDGGLHLAAIAARGRPGTAVLYVSGRPMTDGMRAMLVEPSKFLPKPYTDDQLVGGISALLRE
jgi:DNA-binding NtrC family response regulator